MYKFIKRLLDIIFSLLGLALFLLPIILISIIIKCTSKGPVIFKQKRIGKNAKVFDICKFRTMCIGAENGGVYANKQDARITKFGKFLRASSLDEIPQLINILKGEMSFVGPRPPLEYHPWTIDKYTNEQLHMFDVRPGITGWAQVNGRKTVQWNQRILLNLYYIDNIGFWLDLKIFFMTIGKVLANKDNSNTKETVEKINIEKE